MLRRWTKPLSGLLPLLFLAVYAAGCVTTSEKVAPFQATSQNKPSGFFDRMLDNFSERVCNAGKFTCPYGLGSAGEPCECVGPNNVVYNGRTVK